MKFELRSGAGEEGKNVKWLVEGLKHCINAFGGQFEYSCFIYFYEILVEALSKENPCVLALYKVTIPVRPCWDEGRKNVKSLVGGPNHCKSAVIRCLGPSNLHFSRHSNLELVGEREGDQKCKICS